MASGFAYILAKNGEKSGTALKALPAPGAGDGDFSLAPGDTHGLAASGADEIAVVAVLDPIQHQLEAAVFLIPSVDISGQTAEDGPAHQSIAGQPEQNSGNGAAEEGRKQTGEQTGTQNHHIEPVGAVAADHEAAEAHADLSKEIAQPAVEVVH